MSSKATKTNQDEDTKINTENLFILTDTDKKRLKDYDFVIVAIVDYDSNEIKTVVKYMEFDEKTSEYTLENIYHAIIDYPEVLKSYLNTRKKFDKLDLKVIEMMAESN